MFKLCFDPKNKNSKCLGVSQFYSWEQCNSTLITAYYNIKSKHSHEQYVEWMSNMLTLQDCMVIFTDPDMEETIRS